MNPVTGKLMAKYTQSIYMQIKTIKKRSGCFCSAVHCVNLICREAGRSDCLILNRREKMWFLFLVDNMRVMFNGTIGLIVSECLLSACIDYLILHNVTATAAEYKEPFWKIKKKMREVFCRVGLNVMTEFWSALWSCNSALILLFSLSSQFLAIKNLLVR